jgi:hypothetical protein
VPRPNGVGPLLATFALDRAACRDHWTWARGYHDSRAAPRRLRRLLSIHPLLAGAQLGVAGTRHPHSHLTPSRSHRCATEAASSTKIAVARPSAKWEASRFTSVEGHEAQQARRETLRVHDDRDARGQRERIPRCWRSADRAAMSPEGLASATLDAAPPPVFCNATRAAVTSLPP